jgi:hypothetical protein
MINSEHSINALRAKEMTARRAASTTSAALAEGFRTQQTHCRIAEIAETENPSSEIL